MKTIIISGASGFIGNALSNYFYERGDRVIQIVRRSGAAKFESINIQNVNSDLFAQFTSNETTVINLSGANIGAKKWTTDYKREITDSRVSTTKNLVNVLKNSGIQLINASATGYYGNRGDEMLDESAKLGEGFLSAVCRDWESAAGEYSPLLIARFGVVLGKGGGAFDKMISPFKLLAGGHIGSGKQWIPWIHITDLIELIAFAADNRTTGIMNCVSPQSVTYRQFANITGKVLGRPSKFNVPTFAIKLLLGEQAELVLNSQRAVPIKALNLGFEFKFESMESALIDLIK